jgi:nicotinamidase-related amidase
MKPWHGIISEEEQRADRAAGFGRPTGIGKRPALLIIDVQYRHRGTTPLPFFEAIKEFPTSCGEVAWKAVGNIKLLVDEFRKRGWPVLYPHVAPKVQNEGGRLADKVPAIMNIAANGYQFVKDIRAPSWRCVAAQKHPSAFFATALDQPPD